MRKVVEGGGGGAEWCKMVQVGQWFNIKPFLADWFNVKPFLEIPFNVKPFFRLMV